MPETRYAQIFKDGKLIRTEPYTVSDEQLAEEADQVTFQKVDTMIDNISTLADAKTFLKKLVVRLAKRGVLP